MINRGLTYLLIYTYYMAIYIYIYIDITVYLHILPMCFETYRKNVVNIFLYNYLYVYVNGLIGEPHKADTKVLVF